jgi:hypothetical protein
MSKSKQTLTDLYESTYLGFNKNNSVIHESRHDEYDDEEDEWDEEDDEEKFPDVSDLKKTKKDKKEEDRWKKDFEPKEKTQDESTQPTDDYGAPIRKKKKKNTMKEQQQFNKLFKSIISEEFDDEDEFGGEEDEFGGDDEFGDDEFGDEDEFGGEMGGEDEFSGDDEFGDDQFGGEEDTVTISRSALQQLQSIISDALGEGLGDEFADEADSEFDEFSDDEGFDDADEFADDEIPLESYTGEPSNQKDSDYVDSKGSSNQKKVKVGGKPNVKTKKAGIGTFSPDGRPKNQAPSRHLKGQNINQGSAKVKVKSPKPKQGLY